MEYIRQRKTNKVESKKAELTETEDRTAAARGWGGDLGHMVREDKAATISWRWRSPRALRSSMAARTHSILVSLRVVNRADLSLTTHAKKKLCNRIKVLTSLTVVTSQYMHVSSHHIAHFKLTRSMSTISRKPDKKKCACVKISKPTS